MVRAKSSTRTVAAYLTLAALQHLTYDVPENGLIKPSLTSTGTVTAYLTLVPLQRLTFLNIYFL